MKANSPAARHLLVLLIGLGGAALVVRLLYGAQQTMTARADQQRHEQAAAFAQLLDTCRTLASNGACEEAAARLAAADSRSLTREQRRRLFLGMADVSAAACRTAIASRQDFFVQIALNYFAQATALSATDAERAAIRLDRARFMAQRGDWAEVLGLVRSVDTSALSAADAAANTLLHAEACTQLRQYRQALDVLNDVLAAASLPETRAAATYRQAELLLRLSEEDPATLDNVPPEQRQPPEVLRARARALLEDVLDMANATGPLPDRARVGLLRVAAAEGDHTTAYRLANRLRLSGAAITEKAEAQLIIAQLEERQGDPMSAIEIYQRYLELYPQRADFVEVYGRLHELMVSQGRWQRLIAFVSDSQQRRFELPVFRRLLAEFHPNGRAYDSYATAPGDGRAYLQSMVALIALMAELDPAEYAHVADDAAFTNSVVNYALGNFETAEAGLAVYQQQGNDPEKLEAATFLDLLCGLSLERAPAVVAWRCRLYLGRFPEGLHRREIMALLLRTYYEMHLYGAARDIARKILIGDLIVMDKGGADVASDQWLTTVIRLAQCYAQLGDHQRADLIFRLYADRIASHPFAAEVYRTWCRSAVRRDQLHEAVRRLDVALLQVQDGNERLSLELERNVRAMEIPLPGAATNTRNLLDVLEAGGEPTGERRKLIRQAYEALLAYSAENDVEQFRDLRDRAIRHFGGEPWAEYWTLRSLTGLFGQADLEELGREHRRILDLRAGQQSPDAETARFIGRQLELIEALTDMRRRERELQARGLN